MTRVVLATLAVATPMGQQEYEQQLAAHLPAQGIDLRVVQIRSLRSTLSGDMRLPLNVLSRAPLAVQRAAASRAYGPADLVHRADLRLPAARREVVTVHDLAPLRFKDEGSIAPASLAALTKARAVIVPSQFSGDELRKLTGRDDAIVIHNGIDPSVWDEIDPSVTADLDLPEHFVLHSGGATTRKNLGALATAWRQLAQHHRDVGLVLCGPHDPRRSAAFEGLPRVRMLGRVEREIHLALMSAATVVVVPSSYEGFGFPALEAMARGTAVVAADASSLPEVCGDAALLVTPTADGLAAGIDSLLTDPDRRGALALAGAGHARTFTWQRSATAHADVYRSV